MDRAARGAAAVTEVAIAALGAPPGVDVVPAVLSSLREAVGADSSGFYEHERQGWSTPYFISPSELWRILPMGRAPTASMARMHPGVRHLLSPTAGAPYAVTDLVGERGWQSSELVSLMRPDWGRNYQFAIPVAQASVLDPPQVWVLGRTTHDFGDLDRAVAEALAPLLTAVARHWSVLEGLRRDAALGTLLTERELGVLALQARGLTARSIASRLAISPRTANKHAEHIYRKLGVRSRQEAVQACTVLGVLPPPSRADHVRPGSAPVEPAGVG
jgi:DNA-binding CsgD family transcriptional regulator